MRVGDRVRLEDGQTGRIKALRRELDRIVMGRAQRGEWIAVIELDGMPPRLTSRYTRVLKREAAYG